MPSVNRSSLISCGRTFYASGTILEAWPGRANNMYLYDFNIRHSESIVFQKINTTLLVITRNITFTNNSPNFPT